MTTGRINQITYCFLVLTANRFRFTEVKLLSAAIAVLLGLELPKPRPELTHATVSRLQTTAPRARRPGLLKSRAHAARVLKYRPKGKRTILYARLIFTTPSSSENPVQDVILAKRGRIKFTARGALRREGGSQVRYSCSLESISTGSISKNQTVIANDPYNSLTTVTVICHHREH